MARSWLAAWLGISLAALTLAHQWSVWPNFFVAWVVMLVWAATSGLRGRSLLASGLMVWTLVRLVLVRPLPPFGVGFVIDRNIATTEAYHFQQNWSGELWSWLVVVAAWAVAPRLNPFRRAVLVISAVIVANSLTCWFFNPAQRAQFTSPRLSGYAHDHHLYQSTWLRMKEGQGYYAAMGESFRQDRRGTGATVRPPLLFWLWSLLPTPPEMLLLGYLLLSAASIVSLYWLSGLVCGPDWGLLAPLLLSPWIVYGAAAGNYTFVEYWALPLVFVTMGWALSGRPQAALLAAVATALLREFHLLLWLAAAQLQKPRRVLTAVASGAFLLVYYLAHRAATRSLQAANGFDSSASMSGFVGAGWSSLQSCLDYAQTLIWGGNTWLLVGIPLALWGLSEVREGAQRRFLAVLSLNWLVFALIGHRPVEFEGRLIYPPDYWGLFLLPLWLPWLGAGLKKLAHSDQDRG